MNQIAAGIGNKSVAAQPLHGVPTIDRDACGGRKITGHPTAAFHRPAHLPSNAPARAHNTPRFIRAQPKHLRRRAIGRDAHPLTRQRVMRVAARIPRWIHQRLQMTAVAAGKFSSCIIKAHPVLRRAVFRAQLQCARVERKIPATERYRIAGGVLHTAAHVRGAAMNPVVQSPSKAIEHRLHIQSTAPRAEALEHRAVHIRLAVAGGVFQKQNLRSHTHKHAAIVADHRRGPGESIGKHHALLKPSVPIGILQSPNPAGIGLAPFGVADHLHHIQPPVRIKTHGNRIRHQRLSCRQLQVKPRLHLKRLARLGHRRMRYTRQLHRIRFRFCRAQNSISYYANTQKLHDLSLNN